MPLTAVGAEYFVDGSLASSLQPNLDEEFNALYRVQLALERAVDAKAEA